METNPEEPANRSSPSTPDLLARALSHHQAARYADADAGYRLILDENPADADAWHLWGVLAAQQRRFAESIARIRRALELTPHEPVFLGSLGKAFHEDGQLGEAIDCYRRALESAPEETELRKRLASACERQLDLGIGHHQADRLAEAEACYRDVLRGQPERADAWHLLGQVALNRIQLDKAEERLTRAIELAPGAANFHNSLAALRIRQQRYSEAVVCCQEALRLDPLLVTALKNLGLAFGARKQLPEAERAYRTVIEQHPDDADARVGLANALWEAGRKAEAEAAFRQALHINPQCNDAHFGLGSLLRKENRRDEALACFAEVASRDPGYPYVSGFLADCRARMGEWAGDQRSRLRLIEQVRAGEPCATPFVFLRLCDDPAAQHRCARTHRQRLAIGRADRPSPQTRHSSERIRLAYVSPDFGEHPVAHLIADLIEAHDRSRFEVFGVSLAREKDDPWRRRLIRGFDHFLDVRNESDEAVASRLGSLGIDIAIDLAGYTAASRPGIFAARAAPIQVNYLGFPATMGAEFIDYILADRFVIPEEVEGCYTEKVVCLPDSFQCPARRQLAERTPERAELGLPESGFVFCCFNNSYKINPDVFDVWMRLLRRVEGSVLWLFSANRWVEANLRREAEARGVDPDRLIFAPRVPQLPDHLARYRQADLFLDTWPYNAATTAGDALWAGLPVLTCAGRSLVSRTAGSLLLASGLPELVTDSVADYEALAWRLATRRDEYAAIREKLERNRSAAALFNVDRFRRHIEAAYQRMWEIGQRGEAPAPFAIAPIDASAEPGPAESAGRTPSTATNETTRSAAATPPPPRRKVLHVGCGPADPEKLPALFRTDRWQEVRLDIDPACQPDIVGSITAMSAVETGSCAAIFSSHNLEHLYPHEVPLALKEFVRVLAPDGFAFVTVPDLQQVAGLVAKDRLDDPAHHSPAGPIAPLDMLYGHRPSLARGNLFMAHRTGFTAKTLSKALLEAGFVQVGVRRDGRFGLWAIAYRQTRTAEQLAEMESALFPS